MVLKSIRIEKGLTQEAAAKLLGVSRRTYVTYESNETKLSEKKLQFVYQTLEEYGRIDEEHGILTLEQIKRICGEVFNKYDVEYCYLFGSYAKGLAQERSDIDLLVDSGLKGMAFFGLLEDVVNALGKDVDLLDTTQVIPDSEVDREIARTGVVIYGS